VEAAVGALDIVGVAARAAAAHGVDQETAMLAAQVKVASAVTGVPDLYAGEETWRDLVARVTGDKGRAEAIAAWQGVEAQLYVTPDTVAGCLGTALRRLTESPDEPHNHGGLLEPEAIAALVAASAGPLKPLPDRRLHELFEDGARSHPDAVAAVQGDRSWTYRKLNGAANKIARSLCLRGLNCEDVVAVAAGRSLEWLAAVLAVFKAGGSYLPLEPHFPAARMATAMRRSECRWALTQRGLANLEEAIAGLGAVVDLLQLDELLAGDVSEDDLGVRVAADQLAYIYFTSGSTGEPKGAMCEHAGFLNHILSKIEDLGVRPGAIIAQTAPQCFDISLWQLVCALLVGGRTHIVEQEVILDADRFLGMLAEAGVQVVQLVPSYLDVVLSWLEERPRELRALRCVAVTGEALKTELVRRWFAAFPDVPLVNCYGTTECSDESNHGVMHAVPAHRSVPLGPPLRNTRVYIMDERLQLVPPGAPGEIVVAGISVGRGYVNDEARTRAVFARDPYRPADRLYRSGDFGRRLPTGEFEYLGRRDSLVKVSGFRIEIGEIENRLIQVPGVRAAAVVVVGSAAAAQLVGYYAGASAPAPGEVGRALDGMLPYYMVPRRMYRLAELPLGDNGKIDKKALTARAAAGAERTAGTDPFEAPETDTERRIAALWSELLKVPVERIGRHTVFAELGGTSLSAIRLSIALGRRVTVGDLADAPTIADVAVLVDGKAAGRTSNPTARSEPDTSATAVEPGALPVLPASHGPAWAAEHRGEVLAHVHEFGAAMLRGLGVESAADVAAVAAALGIEPMPEREAFAPRSSYAEAVYSSSHWPADEPMCMHNERSYAAEVPGSVVFGCLTAPAAGGRTAVADSQLVLRGLPPELVAPFQAGGWVLTRMYHEVGVPWTYAFGTRDREEVDAYCAAAGLAAEWLPDGRLRTRQRRAAVVAHPRTGIPGWFNQIAFLNEMTLDPVIRDYLIDLYGPTGLPFNTTYADGSPVTAATVDKINEVYDAVALGEPWQAGDVMVVDNIRMAHNREPYSGAREIVVVFGDSVRLAGHVLALDPATGGAP
jgi:amino acid adenylation domain-containing protein